MTKEGFTKIVNIFTPGAGVLVLGCGHIRHIVKMHYFFKNPLLYSQLKIRQTMYIPVVLMTKEGSTKIVNFMTPGAGVLMLGHGHISHLYYLLLCQYTAHWLLLFSQGIMILLSYTIVDFHLFYDVAVDIQIWAALTRSQCKVSDTQVTVKVCGPLVNK